MATAVHKLQGAGGVGGAYGAGPHWIALLGGSGSDVGLGVAIDSSDNIIVTGNTASDGAGGADSITAKYDSSGTLLWDKTLGGSGTEEGYGVAIDSSDNIIICGVTTSDGAGGNDLLVAKYNSSGTLLWDKTLGGSGTDIGLGVVTDSSDNIIVTGYTWSDGAGNADALVAKYNSSGTLLWDKTLGGSGTDVGYRVAIDSSDNIIVIGYTGSDGAGGDDLLVAKYNSSGTLLWDKTLGGSLNEYGRDVAIDSSDNIIVTGQTSSDGAGGIDLLVAKYDSSGNLLWDKTLGGTGSDRGYGVAVDSSGNIIVTGQTNSDGAGDYDVLVAKYDSSGTLLWDKTLGGTGSEIGRGVVIDSSDNIIVIGYTNSDGAGSNDLLVAKLHPDGLGDGTYGSLVYQDAVLTDAAAVLTDAAAVITDAAAVLTSADAVLTDAAAVLTEELLPITI